MRMSQLESASRHGTKLRSGGRSWVHKMGWRQRSPDRASLTSRGRGCRLGGPALIVCVRAIHGQIYCLAFLSWRHFPVEEFVMCSWCIHAAARPRAPGTKVGRWQACTQKEAQEATLLGARLRTPCAGWEEDSPEAIRVWLLQTPYDCSITKAFKNNA